MDAVSLAEQFIPLARSLAWRAARAYPVAFEDAYSDALFGLVVAEDHCTNRSTFPAYAKKTVWFQILRGMRDRSKFRSDRNTVPPVMVGLEYVSDLTSSSDVVEEASARELWDIVDDHLSQRDSYVVRSYFQRDMSQQAIARIVGVSQMQVSRIIQKACLLLKEEM